MSAISDVPLRVVPTVAGRARRAALRWLARLGLVLLGITAPLLLLELSLRTFGPFLPGSYSVQLYHEPHPVYGRFHVPNTVGWLRTDEFRSHVVINSRGLREREIPMEKPVDLRRIVVLGDSFVEGAEVPVEATLTGQLERLLVSGDGTPTQVINAGVRTFGTSQEYLLLSREMLDYSPDVVVLVFYSGNDASNNSPQFQKNPAARRKPYFSLSSRGELRPLSFRPERAARVTGVEQLRRSSLLFSVVDTGILGKIRSPLADDNDNSDDERPGTQLVKYELPFYSASSSDDVEEAWQVSGALVAATAELSRAAGAQFLLVNAPAKWEVYPEDWEDLLTRANLPRAGWDLDGPNRRVSGIANHHGIPYLDLRPIFRDAAAQSPRLFFRKDVHWTAAGHEQAARAIAGMLSVQPHPPR